MFTAEFPGRACVWTPCLYQELPINNCSKSVSIRHVWQSTIMIKGKARNLTEYVPGYCVWWDMQSTCQRSETVSTNLQYFGLLGKLSQQTSPTPQGKKCFWLCNYLPSGKEFTVRTWDRNLIFYVRYFLSHTKAPDKWLLITHLNLNEEDHKSAKLYIIQRYSFGLTVTM